MALVLIIMSYLSQVKAKNQIQKLNEQLSTTQGSLKKMESLTELTAGQTAKLEETTKELEKANEKIKELEKKNEEYALATGETGIYSKTIKAYEYFWQLERYYRARYYTKSRELIKEINDGGYAQFFSNEAAAEYEKITNDLK